MSPFPKQPYDPDLIAIAALATTSYGRSLLTAADNIAVIGSLTKAQLDAAVSDDNVAYLGQSQTFVGNQAVTGNITATGALTVTGIAYLDGGTRLKNTYIGTSNILQWEGGSYPTLRYANGGDLQVYEGATNNVILTVAKTTGNITASGTGTLGTYTVATLPAAGTNSYAEANVSDALTPTMGSTVAAGGAVKTKVRSNGTNWTVAGI